MDTKGFEKKPWFPYLKNMYDKIEGDMMSVDAKGYEEKPWWPYVLDLQEKIDAGGGGGSSTITIAQKQSITTAVSQSLPFPMGSITVADGAFETKTIDVIFDGVEYKNIPFVMTGYGDIENQMPVFTNYPFFVANSWRGGWKLFTKVAGTYEIEIKGTPTNVPYWNCHVTVINANKDTNLFAEGFIVDDAVATRHLQVINTQEFDVIAVGGYSELYFTNTDGKEGVVTNVTGSGVYVPDDGYVDVWGDVTITAKGSK